MFHEWKNAKDLRTDTRNLNQKELRELVTIIQA